MSRIFLSLMIMVLACQIGAAQDAVRGYGIAMHGAPKFTTADALKFSHINPNASKGGVLRQSVVGTFDTLNPFIVRGTPAPNIRGYVVESLMARALDEPFTLYGLIAETVTMAEDRSAITFHLHPKAHFSDGAPILAQDVAATFQFLKTKGRPNFRSAFNKVAAVEVVNERTIAFKFPNANDRELPLILGLMPVLPRAAIESSLFDTTLLSPFTASGPYLIAQVKPGQQITLKKNPKWWGAALPINQGLYNFDEIQLNYYRDANVAFEGFKSGAIDFRIEEDATRWAKAYDFPAYHQGIVNKREAYSGMPKPMAGFVFNTRKPPFNDMRVRQAITRLYNFEWVNANLYNGVFKRTHSFFEGSELSSVGTAASPQERALLAAFPDAVNPEVMAGKPLNPPQNISGKDRASWLAAKSLLEAAGYTFAQGRVVHAASGAPLSFEIIVTTREHEKNAVAFNSMLQAFGIQAQVRLVDSAQFERRRQNFEFDLMPFTYAASLSPGNEQIFRWGSKNANVKGSFNLAGLQSPAADAMIDAFLHAQEREQFIQAVRAFDRVLISSHSLLPLYHAPVQWVAHWQHIGVPEKTPLLGFAPEVMWRDDNLPIPTYTHR